MSCLKWLGGGLLLSVLVACGGGGESTEPTTPMAIGAFIDSPVQGLPYTSGSQQGVTDSEGRFTYERGQGITFRLGGIVLPTVPADDLVTPLSVFGTVGYDDPRAVNLARLLQSLDSDGNPANGITISASALAAAQDIQLTDFGAADFDQRVAPLIQSVGRPGLVSATDAVAHMKSQSVRWYSTKMTAALAALPEAKASFESAMAEYLKTTDAQTASRETKAALDKMTVGVPDMAATESNRLFQTSTPDHTKSSQQAAKSASQASSYCWKYTWAWGWVSGWAWEMAPGYDWVWAYGWNPATSRYEYFYQRKYQYAWRYVYGTRWLYTYQYRWVQC